MSKPSSLTTEQQKKIMANYQTMRSAELARFVGATQITVYGFLLNRGLSCKAPDNGKGFKEKHSDAKPGCFSWSVMADDIMFKTF